MEIKKVNLNEKLNTFSERWTPKVVGALIKYIFTIVFLLLTNAGYGQVNQIKIEFKGNAGLYLSDGTTNLYVDFPYKSGAYGYMKYKESELNNIKENAIFLFTHRHADHYSKKLLKSIKKDKKGKVYGNWNTRKLKKLNSSTENFSIQFIKTKHKFTFKHFSYIITWHGKRIFISGDTTNPETVGKTSNLDWAFIPNWLYNNAKSKNITIQRTT